MAQAVGKHSAESLHLTDVSVRKVVHTNDANFSFRTSRV